MTDSGATREFISEEFIWENRIETYSLPNAIRIRLADGTISLARQAVKIRFYLGSKQIEREFVVTRLQGDYQGILGYSFLKDINPEINWTNGTIKLRDDNDSLTTATVQKRTPDVQIISAKQMARMIKRNIKHDIFRSK